MKKIIELKAAAKNTQELVMYGEVSRWELSSKDVVNALKQIDAKVDTLEIRLNSPGGDVFEGIAIYNVLKQSRYKKKIMVDGMAFSIASIIALAGDEIVMGEGAQFMIHSPWTFAMGNSRDLLAIIDRLDRVEGEMVKIYKKATGMSETEILRLMSEETFFTAEESIEFGFATDLFESDDYLDLAASVKECQWILKKDKVAKNKKLQEKIVNSLNSINDFLARKK